MESKLTLEIDKEFLETYRGYKVDSILEDDKMPEASYSALSEFIENSTYNLNSLFEEINKEDIQTLILKFEDYSVKKNYKPIGIEDFLLDELFGTADDDSCGGDVDDLIDGDEWDSI